MLQTSVNSIFWTHILKATFEKYINSFAVPSNLICITTVSGAFETMTWYASQKVANLHQK